jgi:alpha-L-fucosidase 2
MIPSMLAPVNFQNIATNNGTYSNMLDAYCVSTTSNIFQIDANLGGPAAICEMLMQSTMASITLLPALPTQWGTGSVSGLCARGGFTVAMTWANSALVSATITSVGGTQTTLSYNNVNQAIQVPLNGSITWNGTAGGV